MSTFKLKSEVVVKPAEVATSYTLLNAVDSYFMKAVVATISFGGEKIYRVIVWKGEEYEKIGQWTDTDLFAALEPAVEAFVARGFKNFEEEIQNSNSPLRNNG